MTSYILHARHALSLSCCRIFLLQSILEPRCSEEASAAISKSVQGEEDGKVEGWLVVLIAVVAAGALCLGVGLYLLCRRQKNNKSQPAMPAAAEKEQDETVAEEDDATEVEEHP